MDFDAGGTERKETVWVFAEVEDQLFGMEGAVFGLVQLFGHRSQPNFLLYTLYYLKNFYRLLENKLPPAYQTYQIHLNRDIQVDCAFSDPIINFKLNIWGWFNDD